VAIDRLEDRLAAAQVRKVLSDDVHVVAVRVKRRDTELRSLLAVVAVVVIGANVSDVFLAEYAQQPAGNRGLAGRRVADDAEDHWAGQLGSQSGASWSGSSNTLLSRTSCASIRIKSSTVSGSPRRAAS